MDQRDASTVAAGHVEDHEVHTPFVPPRYTTHPMVPKRPGRDPDDPSPTARSRDDTSPTHPQDQIEASTDASAARECALCADTRTEAQTDAAHTGHRRPGKPPTARVLRMRSPTLVSVPDSKGERSLLDAGRRNSFSGHRRRGGADVDTSGVEAARQIGVLLVDERWAASHRVCAPLNRQRSIHVLAHTDDSGAAVSLATHLRPDVCLVSRSIAPVMALTLIDRLKHLERPPRVLLYPDVADAEIAAAAVCAGADGLISRAAEPAQIAAAIEAVAAGGRLFPTLQPSTARRVADLVGDGDRVIVSMLLLRARSDDIAETLGIGLRALHTRRRQILQKLDDAL